MSAPRTTVVVGGNRGIGQAVVRMAAAAGNRVAWNYRDPERGRKVCESLIRELDGAATFAMAMDSTDETQVKAYFAALGERFGRIDELVYAAGLTNAAKLESISFDEWRKYVDINLNGAFLCARAALPMMERGAAIVLVGSGAAFSGGGGRADYAAAKAGLAGLGRALAKELAPRGIRCNTVHPALIETDLLVERYPDPAKRAEVGKQVPLGRVGKPEDVAAAVRFFLSPEAGFITGQELLVDGGRTFLR